MLAAMISLAPPVPWMLEAAIVLELVTDQYVESAIIAARLVFNERPALFEQM